MKTGSPAFNGVAVMEITVNFLEVQGRMKATAAFVNTETGATHGSTTCSSWSSATLQHLGELRESMENDLAAMHFTDASSSSLAEKSLGGIGEALEGDGGVSPIG